MENGKSRKLPGKSIRYLAICAFGVLVFVIVGIYPRVQSISKLDAKITNLHYDIETQRILFPVYETLMKKSRIKEPEDLPKPRNERLDRSKVVMIPDTFRDMALMSKLKPVEVIPELNGMTRGSGFQSVVVRLTGDFLAFRDFLILASGVPYLAHIETIQIKPAGDDREFHLKLWLALET